MLRRVLQISPTVPLNPKESSMGTILSEVELYLLKVLLSEASSPAVKGWALTELKAAESAVSNKLLQTVLQAVEGFLAAPAAA
jgi:hypothetical protein